MSRLPTIVLCAALATFIARLDTNIVGIALPAIATHFHIGAGTASNILLYYLLVISVLLIPLGGLGDRIGFRKLLLAGYAVFTAGSLLCGLSGSMATLTWSRALQGGGAALMIVAAYSLVPRRLPLDRVGKAMGVLSTMGSVGILVGTPLGGVLTQWLTWRSIFLINLPVGVWAIWLAWRDLEPDEADKRDHPPFDWTGSLLTAGCVVLLVLGVDRLGTASDFWMTIGLLAGGTALAGILVLHQRRSRHPLFDPAFFADRRYLRYLAAQGLMFMIVAGHGFALPFYLDRVMGLSHQASGLAMALFPIGVSLAAPLGGHMADRIPPTVVLGVGVTGNALVTGIFALALHLGATWAVYPYLPVMGLFVGAFLAPSAKLLLTGFARGSQGMATSLFLTVNNMAMALGVSVSALALTWRAGTGHAVSHAPQVFFPLYALLTAICLTAAGLVLVNSGGRAGR